MTILITGGAGFIGSNFVFEWLAKNNECIVNLDKLTYAGNLDNLTALKGNKQHLFVSGDINDHELVFGLLVKHNVRAVIHFAAESHVDRSIHAPNVFIETNVVGTFTVLEVVRRYWSSLAIDAKEQFRFLHISTDEVFGSLTAEAPAFTELHRYEPNSPYSASKAASDHIVRAYYHTYGLPCIITNCSNNYGPYQFPEKFIPLCIHNAMTNQAIPIYGDGQQIRDWLYVNDHCRAICRVLEAGTPGATYNIGGWNEKTNMEVVQTICAVLDEIRPRADKCSHIIKLVFVKDRPGHDIRYAMDASKIEKELGWKPLQIFETGIKETIAWYLDNQAWVNNIVSGDYRCWVEKQYE